jgi:hypothetical protein
VPLLPIQRRGARPQGVGGGWPHARPTWRPAGVRLCATRTLEGARGEGRLPPRAHEYQGRQDPTALSHARHECGLGNSPTALSHARHECGLGNSPTALSHARHECGLGNSRLADLEVGPLAGELLCQVWSVILLKMPGIGRSLRG